MGDICEYIDHMETLILLEFGHGSEERAKRIPEQFGEGKVLLTLEEKDSMGILRFTDFNSGRVLVKIEPDVLWSKREELRAPLFVKSFTFERNDGWLQIVLYNGKSILLKSKNLKHWVGAAYGIILEII